MATLNKFIALIKKHVGISLMALTWLIFFSRILIWRYVYFLDDLKIIYYPLEVAYAKAQLAWQLPVWSNLFGFGQPLMSWGQLGFFIPLHFILRALNIPTLDLLQISVMGYFALGLCGMFLFLRRQNLPEISSAFGAIIFVFSGFSIGHLNHVNFYTGTMVLPWLLWALVIFLQNPTLRRSIWISLIGSIIALSAQPQIASYCFVIAGIYALAMFLIKHHRESAFYYVRIVSFSLIAIILAAGLSSFAVLPVKEFLPLTERSDSLSQADLLDFSYPPFHAVTLIVPYFFGDHVSYWGPKGFQELAAYVGVIPLLMAGLAVTNLKKQTALRLVALIFIAVALCFGLGTYSPLYRFLVVNNYWPSFSIPGRFVLFFDLGIAILASLALSELQPSANELRQKRLWKICASLILPALLFAPFLWYIRRSLHYITIQMNDSRLWVALLLALAGLGLYLVSTMTRKSTMKPVLFSNLLVGVTALTLLIFGWNYNPVSLRSATSKSPFISQMTRFEEDNKVPPRIYSAEQLLQSDNRLPRRPTSVIAPNFTAYQPMRFSTSTPCATIPMYAHPGTHGEVSVSLQDSIGGSLLDRQSVSTADVLSNDSPNICWRVNVKPQQLYFAVFASSGDSGINLYAQPNNSDEQAYWVRKINPSTNDVLASRKTMRIAYRDATPSPVDQDILLMTRHLQAATGASSARWIGALSIRSYRDFIEMFFANDYNSPIDGDGVHVIQSRSNLFNMAGVTHYAQKIPFGATDEMPKNGYGLLSEYNWAGNSVRLYENSRAYPKAFLVHNAQFVAADDDQRAIMTQANFDAKKIVLVNGAVPPMVESVTNKKAEGTADIIKYSNTRVDIEVSVPDTEWLVLSDASTPQWQTMIDGKQAPYYTAYTMFRAAQVPPGKHTVSFVYKSPAIEASKKLTGGALVITSALLVGSLLSWRRKTKSDLT